MDSMLLVLAFKQIVGLREVAA